jgi:hypothetical protein
MPLTVDFSHQVALVTGATGELSPHVPNITANDKAPHTL